ncbi:MAG: hypothetical protein KatS3mg115_0315 [Candidatus Poribacteria bacterium]|nr:MAG: hypothetical protein KatS3mg115_0315 [Candidatus Poribacteria bacterium]
MGLVVQKYGGSSVADVEKIRHVARRVIKTKNAGNDVVVVVSAMGKTTDNLIALAKQIMEHPPERELDMLLATGEQVSIALLAMAIHAEGHRAVSLTGPQVGIVTDPLHGRARIHTIRGDRVREALREGYIVIVAGFQGTTIDGQITTLGRGGSDTTAGSAGSGAEGRLLRHLYRRGRGLHRRPTGGSQRPTTGGDHLRGDVGAGQSWSQGASLPFGRAGLEVSRPSAGALYLY